LDSHERSRRVVVTGLAERHDVASLIERRIQRISERALSGRDGCPWRSIVVVSEACPRRVLTFSARQSRHGADPYAQRGSTLDGLMSDGVPR
jgi:hypothetical protein